MFCVGGHIRPAGHTFYMNAPKLTYLRRYSTLLCIHAILSSMHTLTFIVLATRRMYSLQNETTSAYIYFKRILTFFVEYLKRKYYTILKWVYCNFYVIVFYIIQIYPIILLMLRKCLDIIIMLKVCF